MVNQKVNKIPLSFLEKKYKEKNIDTCKSELMKSFILDLSKLVFSTYLGDDVTKGVDILNHFNWCWKKTILKYKMKKIDINFKGEHYNYLINFYYDFFYNINEKNEKLEKKLLIFLNNALSLTNDKTESQYKVFLNVYKNMINNIEK